MEPIPVRCRIPEHLERIGKKQQWLADKVGMSKQRMSEIVNLRSTNITIKRAVLIAYYLECKVDDLWKWEVR